VTEAAGYGSREEEERNLQPARPHVSASGAACGPHHRLCILVYSIRMLCATS